MGPQDYARLVALLSGDPMTAEADLRQTRSQMINVQYWMNQLAKETEVLLAVLSAG
jgi:hypothetical protein